MERFWYVPVLTGYAGLVFYTVLHHEPWFDEAQAWLIARDASLSSMFSDVLRYEGHPPLWYLVLKLAIACGLPYECLGLLSGAIATAGMAVLLVKSPFPKPIKLILAINYYLIYQYAVIARSYVLLPLLLFTAATLARRKWERPMRWAISLALLANVCAHSFLIAGGIMFVHLVQLVFRWCRLDGKARRGQIAAVCLYAAAALPVVIVLWPARDCVAKNGFNGGIDFMDLLMCTLNAVDSALYEWPVLSAALLVVSCYWFWRTSVLGLFLAVWLPVLGLFLVLRVYEHHHGILYLAWLFVTWCSMDAFAAMRASGRVDGLLQASRWAMLLFMAGFVLTYGIWTGYCVPHEAAHPYCGAHALAKYLEAKNLTKYRVAAAREWVVAVLPYFEENFIANLPSEKGRSFIGWRRSFHTLDLGFSPDGCLAEPCDIILWPEQGAGVWKNADFVHVIPPNWRCVAYFPGQVIFKNRFTAFDGFAVFMTSRVADELGLPTVDCERTIAGRRTGEVSPDAADGNGDRESAGVEPILAFANLVRKIDPESASWAYRRYEARDNVGNALAQCGSDEEAIACWRVAHGIGPRSDAHNDYGLSLAGSGLFKEAQEEFEQAVEADPRCADAHWNVGACFLRLGKGPQAVARWREALRLDPHNADMVARLACLLATSPDASTRNGVEAARLAERAVQLNGRLDSLVLRRLAAPLGETGQFAVSLVVEQLSRRTRELEREVAELKSRPNRKAANSSNACNSANADKGTVP